MGCKINAQMHGSEYVKAVKEYVHLRSLFLANFEHFRIAILIFKRANDPIRRFDFLYQFTDMCKTEQRLLKILHGFTDEVIAMRKQELSKTSANDQDEDDFGSKKKLALLDLLLQVKIDGEPLSDSDIREEVDTFIFGGHDTTTSGSSFVLYNLAKYPEVQQKVFEEIQQSFDDQSDKVSLQDLSKLNYLDLVIKESMRIFPSIPYIGRVLSEELTAGGYTFPENANMIISPYLMGRDENIFKDPLKFDPQRFEVETTTEKVNSFAYIPFSAGEMSEKSSLVLIHSPFD
jgi:cytochrome P450 family 4